MNYRQIIERMGEVACTVLRNRWFLGGPSRIRTSRISGGDHTSTAQRSRSAITNEERYAETTYTAAEL
jgi:hypothetical protein